MVDFDNRRNVFLTSFHAEERLLERSDIDKEIAKEKVEELAENGQVILEIGNHKYIKNGEFVLPCAEHYYKRNTYIVKSVLTMDMIEEDRFQEVIDKQHFDKDVKVKWVE